ncbi:NADH dehydrogenase [ubiquinone] 1 beta subcomplex subunit 11, mitochondrial [Drosophila miranda]|uniref:NADH dehydrogenase [ubiquinone] 1 beta subcomplex subunit 11, mitochondrial n=1 Tax=Drosophila pseudoobscura pseudoobscura TaxID=46245 RepID=A0A6I8UM94_DROPS|nr:NADH dehydrogenase [ubiquinone] 1 beta subcomplex subunit 11, mitochondrial [Drosophila pseudoobscura]XP_017143673.1 NADH dehydrogenase [ubiquinone] 1 beta subcomplex subunit 11, mitochondrial [Drosophila miranda]
MSALFRVTSRAVALQRSLVANQAATLRACRSIKTSPKKDETIAAPASVTTEDFANPSPKNWMSYGFDYKDQAEDRKATKATFFVTVTLCLVWGTFYWSYLPDTQIRDWAQREGFLELRRREQAGVDLVSPDYVDPASISLPSDEDLANTEIII